MRAMPLRHQIPYRPFASLHRVLLGPGFLLQLSSALYRSQNHSGWNSPRVLVQYLFVRTSERNRITLHPFPRTYPKPHRSVLTKAPLCTLSCLLSSPHISRLFHGTLWNSGSIINNSPTSLPSMCSFVLFYLTPQASTVSHTLLTPWVPLISEAG